MQTFVLILGLILPDGSLEPKVYPHTYRDLSACIADWQAERSAEPKVTWLCVDHKFLPGRSV